jgi:phosphatidylinositol alpha-1,6-mannosyltransferase
MKIGLVTPFFLPQIGGANLYCYELARALGKLGHEVHVFTVPEALVDPSYVKHPVLRGDLEQDLAALAPFEMDVWHGLFFYYLPLALHKSNVFITGHGDDCFSLRLRHRYGWRTSLNQRVLWRLPDALQERINVWLNEREQSATHALYSRALPRLRQLVTVSSFTRDRVLETYPGTQDKTTVIPPGISEHFFGQSTAPHMPDFLLTVTRLDEADRIKNVHNVILALASLKDEFDFHYRIIAGGVWGNYKQELLDLIQAHSLQDRVEILGRQTDEALVDFYSRAGLFILCSYAEPDNFEGFGIVFLEANARGTPVLTTRQGGMADYVVEGNNGLYADSVDSVGIASALRRYFEGRIQFDEAMVKSAPESYRWVHIAERMAAMYEKYREH